MMLLIKQFYLISRYFLHLRTTNSLPTTVLRRPQSMFFLEQGRRSDTQSTIPTAYHITQCNEQNTDSVHVIWCVWNSIRCRMLDVGFRMKIHDAHTHARARDVKVTAPHSSQFVLICSHAIMIY